jgi:two-component system nitrogen regulation sensor histidine kinase GlnL
VIVVSRALRVLVVNAAAEELLGISAARAAGRPLAELPRAGPGLAALAVRCRDTRGVARADVELGPPRGKLPVVASPITAPGSLRGVVLELREDGGGIDLQALAAGLAHEIKNPLAGLKGAADLLAGELPPGSPLASYTELMAREATRVDRLVQSLLDLTRPLSLRAVPENLHRICDDVLLLFRGVPVERAYDPSLPEVSVDRERLLQVLLNLVKNAVEAMPSGAVVRLETGVAPGKRVRVGDRLRPLARIAVLDQGPGLPDGVELFTPFTSTKPTGTGLGLVVSRQIVEAHGGRLELRDRRDRRGVEAEILLPM